MMQPMILPDNISSTTGSSGCWYDCTSSSPPPPPPQQRQQQQQQHHHHHPQYLIRFEMINRTFIVQAPIISSSVLVSNSRTGTTMMEQYGNTNEQQQQQQQPPDVSFLLNYIKGNIISQIRQLDVTTQYSNHKSHHSSNHIDPLIRTLQRHLIHTSNDDMLWISQFDPPYGKISLHPNKCCLRILGGKGGFGTLLKGQSKQSSIHTTKNFTSCRNLQGQRLQQVNDTIHLQLMSEWKDKIAMGIATELDMIKALTNTSSGIPGWHLPLPTWSEVSIKKEYKQNQKILHNYQRQQQMKQQQQTQRKQQQELVLHNYIETTNQMTEQMERTVTLALQQSIQKQKQQRRQQQRQQQQKEIVAAAAATTTPPTTVNYNNKRQRYDIMSLKRNNDIHDDDNNDTSLSKHDPVPPQMLPPIVTMSGNATISSLSMLENNHTTNNISNSNNSNLWNIHGNSNFCTIGVLLDDTAIITMLQQQHSTTSTTTTTTTGTSTSMDDDTCLMLYYEVGIIPEMGIKQIGWASSSSSSSTTTPSTTADIGDDSNHHQQQKQMQQLFQPNSDSGDGVGDCQYSWGYDPTRNIKLHNSSMESYYYKGTNVKSTNISDDTSDSATEQQPPSDMITIGCTYNISTGAISYSYNGSDLGIAYTIDNRTNTTDTTPDENQRPDLIPAISLNEGEQIELRLHQHEMKYLSTVIRANISSRSNIVVVGDVLHQQQQPTSPAIVIENNETDGGVNTIDSVDKNDEDEQKPPAIETSGKGTLAQTDDIPSEGSKDVVALVDTKEIEICDNVIVSEPLPIDLQHYSSANELEPFGLQRLKEELIKYGLKCGGTIQERAERLFAIRNIDDPKDYPTKLLNKQR